MAYEMASMWEVVQLQVLSLYSTYKTYTTFQKSVLYIHDISDGSCVFSDGVYGI